MMGKHTLWIALLGTTLAGCAATHVESPKVCEGVEHCDLECRNGACLETCRDESECAAGCEGGGCDMTCRDAASCTFECEGGGCTFRCEDQDRCVTSCEGGDCRNGDVAPEDEVVPISPGGGDDPTPLPDGPPGSEGTLFCGAGLACQCGTNATCVIECGGGDCDLSCGTNAECWFDCSGGGCSINCGTNADCFIRCPTGDCGLSCGTNADCMPWD